MAAVDPAFAQWLKDDALFVSGTDAAFAARWGERAIETEIISPLATKPGADAEAARQFAFLAGPHVLDRHSVAGLWHSLIGQVVTLTIDRLGYDFGVACFVVDAQEKEGSEMTELLVLRQLTPGPLPGGSEYVTTDTGTQFVTTDQGVTRITTETP